jgi:hypothetical protein
MKKTMDIYTAPESKIVYTGKNGYNSNIEYANKFLNKGHNYTVLRLEVGRSSSKVILKEFPSKSFNSVHFENVGEFETVKPEKYNTYFYYGA